jgi:hypothetical protein
LHRWPALLAWLACAGIGMACAAEPAGPAAALYAQYAALRPYLERNAFGRPLHLESLETGDQLHGDVQAILAYPFAEVESALEARQDWCDILILHLNVKACRIVRNPDVLRVYVGRKFDESASSAHKLDLAYRIATSGPSYFRLSLQADSGPFGTRDYRILVEAVPLERDRTFLHLSYAYRFGESAKMAMLAYLRTVGVEKVGFTSEGRAPDGRPVLVGGLRGAMERNVMRYYLAIDAYLSALSAPASERLEARLHEWFASTEQYPLQLHELDENAYLEMKRKECAPLSGQP